MVKQETKIQLETATFGAGCFWCSETVFKQLKGVESVTSGYAGGEMEKPSYEDVSTGKTGHAEVVQIKYDPNIITYQQLLAVFFATHDPTTLNRQGNDIGPQYRSLILYSNQEQRKQAEDYIARLEQEKIFKKPIITEVKPLGNFYEAADYHHDYHEKNKNQPYCLLVINHKFKKSKKEFKDCRTKVAEQLPE